VVREDIEYEEDMERRRARLPRLLMDRSNSCLRAFRRRGFDDEVSPC